MVIFILLLLPLLLLLILYFIVRPRPIAIPIKNRHVFITGGSIGIGLAIAKKAASEGARISLLSRSLDKLKEAKQSIQEEYQVDVSIFAADVRDYNAIERAIKEAGPIDVLVINHGVFVFEELGTQELDVVKFMIDVNLMGTFNVIKAALPLMKARKDKSPASIAIMSSEAGQVGLYGYTAYSASKFGLRGLAEALQQEVISDNIYVSIICPPSTETPGRNEAIKTMSELMKFIISSSGEVMKAEEVAKITLNAIKSGSFTVPCTFIGRLLVVATAGVSPQTSFLMAAVEVVFAGFGRFVALFYLWSWYRKIEQCQAQSKKVEKKLQ
ncbi:Short-chain dehydrogenase/reductase SDR [Corchorus olitorius]|uniref:3-dehydrosphinganine reductase n=1 Tax=Corchorus olitorius TaxID=93759 RepID=A0A1R3KR02_9ROSI|nr:Short-chain dehydrogenase/reductase SDR [Corchorus olitorius]